MTKNKFRQISKKTNAGQKLMPTGQKKIRSAQLKMRFQQ